MNVSPAEGEVKWKERDIKRHRQKKTRAFSKLCSRAFLHPVGTISKTFAGSEWLETKLKQFAFFVDTFNEKEKWFFYRTVHTKANRSIRAKLRIDFTCVLNWSLSQKIARCWAAMRENFVKTLRTQAKGILNFTRTHCDFFVYNSRGQNSRSLFAHKWNYQNLRQGARYLFIVCEPVSIK